MSHDDIYAPRWIGPDDMPVDLHSEIVPALWMGGTADEDWIHYPAPREELSEPAPYDAVVTLFAWAQPMTWGVEELRYGFGDCELDGANLPRILKAARWAHERWRAGERVLVRCQAGINRAGLVTALVLMLDGRSPREAIEVIRRRRSPLALCNDAFVDWLLTDAAEALRPPALQTSMGSVDLPSAGTAIR